MFNHKTVHLYSLSVTQNIYGIYKESCQLKHTHTDKCKTVPIPLHNESNYLFTRISSTNISQSISEKNKFKSIKLKTE